MPINKNIILIGSTGSIGKNLTEFLSKLKQYRLIIIDHQNSEVAKLANSLNLEYQYINLLNVGDIKEAINNVLDLIPSRSLVNIVNIKFFMKYIPATINTSSKITFKFCCIS